ncbi:MAG TPA: DNA polymerase III subunit delta [Burkholderiales bacterium]|nr:DNA polymerase III subunit delta [Burkholderiales bacterium]
MPSLRPDQLSAHLQRGLAPLYLVHGDDPLLAMEAVDDIRAKARAQGFSEREVLSVERSFDWGALHAANAGMSLFGDRKIVELRIPTGKPGAQGGEAITALCANLSPDTLVVVTLPRLAKRDQSAAWFTALTRAGTVVEIYPLERARLPEWLAGRLARNKQSADRDTLAFLADSVEGNLLAAHQEIQKLALLAPEGRLSFETVRASVMNVARFDAGQLTVAMLGNDRARLTRMLEGLRAEGEATPRLVWIVAEEIRTIARVQRSVQAGRPAAEAARENRVWGEPRVSLVAAAAKRLSRKALLDALAHTARIDRMAKGVAKGDAWDELLQLGLKLAA